MQQDRWQLVNLNQHHWICLCLWLGLLGPRWTHLSLKKPRWNQSQVENTVCPAHGPTHTHGQMSLGTLRAREHTWVALQRGQTHHGWPQRSCPSWEKGVKTMGFLWGQRGRKGWRARLRPWWWPQPGGCCQPTWIPRTFPPGKVQNMRAQDWTIGQRLLRKERQERPHTLSRNPLPRFSASSGESHRDARMQWVEGAEGRREDWHLLSAV